MIPVPYFSSCADKGYDFSIGKFDKFVFVGRPMIAYVNGGVPPYTWSQQGNEFDIANLVTSSQFNRIVTNDKTIVGESADKITVVDSCSRRISFVINCCSTYLCCEQQTIVFSVDNVEQLPVSDSIIKLYGGCPPFRWESLDSRASFLTEWTEVRQNILMYNDLDDVISIAYQITDHCGTVVEGYVYEPYVTYPPFTFYHWGSSAQGQNLTLVTSGAFPNPTAIVDDSFNPYTHYWPVDGAFARKEDGTYFCIGSNSLGQLGLGDSVRRTTLTEFISPIPGVEIESVLGACTSGGSNFMLLEGGYLYAAGHNAYGRLGVGDTTDRDVWTQVGGVLLWSKVFRSSGNRMAAITKGGNLYMWGLSVVSGNEQIPGYTTVQSSPVIISGVVSPVFVGLGIYGTLVVTATSQFFASGQGNYTGSSVDSLGPLVEYTPPWIGAGVRSISYGDSHCVCVATNGTMWVFGFDSNGQLGLGTSPGHKNVFTQIGTDNDWEEVVCGSYVSFAKKTNGDVYCWGINASGQLGTGSYTVGLILYTPTLCSWKFDESLIRGYDSFGAKVAK